MLLFFGISGFCGRLVTMLGIAKKFPMGLQRRIILHENIGNEKFVKACWRSKTTEFWWILYSPKWRTQEYKLKNTSTSPLSATVCSSEPVSSLLSGIDVGFCFVQATLSALKVYSTFSAIMSLKCLACNAMEGSTQSFRIEETLQRSLSTSSEEGGACMFGCFSRRPTHHHTVTDVPTQPQGARVAPVFDVDRAPRLTRCYAVRRDCSFFRDWSVSEIETATLVG